MKSQQQRFHSHSVTGSIEERNVPGKTHAYIIRNGTEFKFGAANPLDNNYYVCRVSYSGKFYIL